MSPPEVAARAEPLTVLLGSTIVTVAGRDWSGWNVVVAGTFSGRWPELERDLLRGLAGLRDWTPPDEEVRDGIRAFRYERGLISAQDFLAWLAQRRLTQADVKAAVARGLARGRWSGPSEPQVSELRLEALAALPAEAICSGALRECATWLIDRSVCAGSSPRTDGLADGIERVWTEAQQLLVADVDDAAEEVRRQRVAELAALDADYRGIVGEVCSDAAIARHVQQHALDWLRFDLTWFACSSAGAAAEIAALLRDGTPIPRIADRSGVAADRGRLYLDELPDSIQPLLAAAQSGEVLGPEPDQDGYRTWFVEHRLNQDVQDPAIRARAERECVDHEMRLRRAGKVGWHERD